MYKTTCLLLRSLSLAIALAACLYGKPVISAAAGNDFEIGLNAYKARDFKGAVVAIQYLRKLDPRAAAKYQTAASPAAAGVPAASAATAGKSVGLDRVTE